MKFWNEHCQLERHETGAVGAVIPGSPMLDRPPNVTIRALDEARRIARAGDAGVSVNDVQLFDIQTLRGAGVEIRESGEKYYLNKAPEPHWFIHRNTGAVDNKIVWR